ncbi:hypothetical protein C8J55DRAFT_589445 [Lentinula edodes]|uniref:Uncharacterized protein n=1 Tax=Lentinula lateritia TaxID=40482 RepID=A0A9W8ZTJ9_9AGAR|nr:hypothetical protein C8J55DRAFT_589445 [Lentinula edodes]
MSSAAAAAEIAALEPTLITIGYDLYGVAYSIYESTVQRYWVAITALWSYEYILTLGDENRYLCLIIIVITNVAYFTPLFTQEICYRYGFVEQLETLFMATIAEILVLLRVYALSGRKQYVLFIAIPLIIVQWALLIYQDVLYKDGTSNLGVLLFARELDTSAVPPLPDIDAYHLCIAIPSTQIVKAGETFLSLFIVYDGLAVSSIIYFVSQQAKGFHLVPILELMQRDGLLYFAVMFSSNFVWLMMALHARPSLGFIQNHISSIMVNRITMNLQKASEEKMDINGRRTVDDVDISDSILPESDIELGSIEW